MSSTPWRSCGTPAHGTEPLKATPGPNPPYAIQPDCPRIFLRRRPDVAEAEANLAAPALRSALQSRSFYPTVTPDRRCRIREALMSGMSWIGSAASGRSARASRFRFSRGGRIYAPIFSRSGRAYNELLANYRGFGSDCIP